MERRREEGEIKGICKIKPYHRRGKQEEEKTAKQQSPPPPTFKKSADVRQRQAKQIAVLLPLPVF